MELRIYSTLVCKICRPLLWRVVGLEYVRASASLPPSKTKRGSRNGEPLPPLPNITHNSRRRRPPHPCGPPLPQTSLASRPCLESISQAWSGHLSGSAVSEPLTRAVRAATRDHPGTNPALPEANSESERNPVESGLLRLGSGRSEPVPAVCSGMAPGLRP